MTATSDPLHTSRPWSRFQQLTQARGFTFSLEIALLGGICALATWVRVPHYRLVPVFTDETEDMYRALLTARGELAPLTDTSTYIGSLWTWMVAAALRLTGESIDAPRTLALVLGVLTVVAAYTLGRVWGGPVAGIIAAALLSTASGHIVVNSHVAWSNCISPLFTTLALAATSVIIRRWKQADSDVQGQPRVLLSVTGLLWGLALQSHPTTIFYVVPAAALLVTAVPSLVRSRWAILGVVLVVFANLNLLAFNFSSRFKSFSYGSEIVSSYAPGEQLTPLVYANRVALFLLGLYQNLIGAVDERAAPIDYLTDVRGWPIAVLALVGVLWTWRRNPAPGLLCLAATLGFPLVLGGFEPVLKGRYLMPLLPVIFASIGVCVADVFRCSPRSLERWPLTLTMRLVVAGVLAVIVAAPLDNLQAYYNQMRRDGRTNARLYRTIDLIASKRLPDEPVLIDSRLDQMALGRGSGRVSSAFRFALAAKGIPFSMTATDSVLEAAGKSRGMCRTQILILGSRAPGRLQELVARMSLQTLEGETAEAHRQAALYGVYRLPPSSTTGDCAAPANQRTNGVVDLSISVARIDREAHTAA